MTACTDDERRRVAERLRRLNFPSMIAMMSILDVGGRDMCARLADLIEPRDTVACDRDALLALAEDVDGAADDSGGFEPLAGMLRDIARSIREACGEVVA